MLTKSLALYCGEMRNGVRVNSVHPGGVRTEMLFNQLPEDPKSQQDALESLGARHPVGFIGEAEDIAHAILFLASEEARFITGASLAVDGGLSL